MESRSPTLEGFKAMFARPSVGLAEIAWRWSFGAACATLLLVFGIEYLDTLPVSPRDSLLLRSGQPWLISHAMARILSGNAWGAMETSVAMAVAFAIGWLGVASLGRGATIQALLAYFRDSQSSGSAGSDSEELRLSDWRSLVGLNFLRVSGALAAGVGGLAAFLIGGAVSPPKIPTPAAAFLISLSVLVLVWSAWSVVNWFLSLAAVFVVVEAQDTFRAIASAVDLVRHRSASVFAPGIWFALTHLTVFVAATSIVALPLGLAGFLPPAVVLGGVGLVTLLYFAAADFLYIGRLAAYVRIVELPSMPVPAGAIPPGPPNHLDSEASPPSFAVDPDELILSDTPEDN
jgi:hypothetical protein